MKREPEWTPEEDALVMDKHYTPATLVKLLPGRTLGAIRTRRNKLRDPAEWSRRNRVGNRGYYARGPKDPKTDPWTPEEDQVILNSKNLTDTALALKLNRSIGAIRNRRWNLSKDSSN